MILEILPEFLRLKSSPSLTLDKIERLETGSNQVESTATFIQDVSFSNWGRKLSEYAITLENYFDQKRNEFLASIFGGNFTDTEIIYKEILNKICTAGELSEVDQKAVNQIQHAFRRFRREIRGNCDASMQNIYKRIRKKMAKVVREQTKNVEYVEYGAWFKKLGLTTEQFFIMLEAVATLQITIGCSNFCRRCNEWALPGVRKHFTFEAIKRLIKELFEAGNSEFALYCASDPLDWKHGDKTIVDILRFMSEHDYHPRFGLLTKIPKGSEIAIEAILNMDADFAVSITDSNRSRVERIERKSGKKLEVQHDFDELLIPTRLDEDFTSIKSSITDNYGCEITPEGAFLVVPTFTSVLNLTGQRRIPITKTQTTFLKKRVGRDALKVEYFKPLIVKDIMGREFPLTHLLDAQIENILLDNGSEQLTPPGIINMREYLKTYKPEAIKRRRSLLPSVAEGLKKEILDQGKYQQGSRQKQFDYFKRRVRDYLSFCKMSSVDRYRKNAFSFYLRSVSGYLKTHPVERELIRYLRREDKEKYKRDYNSLFDKNNIISELLQDETIADTFDLFQILIFQLIDDPNNEAVQKFINNNPAEVTDCYF